MFEEVFKIHEPTFSVRTCFSLSKFDSKLSQLAGRFDVITRINKKKNSFLLHFLLHCFCHTHYRNVGFVCLFRWIRYSNTNSSVLVDLAANESALWYGCAWQAPFGMCVCNYWNRIFKTSLSKNRERRWEIEGETGTRVHSTLVFRPPFFLVPYKIKMDKQNSLKWNTPLDFQLLPER